MRKREKYKYVISDPYPYPYESNTMLLLERIHIIATTTIFKSLDDWT